MQDVAYNPPIDNGTEAYYFRLAAQRLNVPANQIAGKLWDFHEGGTTRTSVSGTTAANNAPAKSGGWAKDQVGDGAAAGSWKYLGAQMGGANPIHIGNQKTEKWLVVIKQRASATPGATTRVAVATLGGQFRAGIVKGSNANFFCAVYGATVINSTVAIDTGVHTTVAWHNGTLVFLSVDNEAPVSAANTNLSTGSDEYGVDWAVGAGEARQDPEIDFFGVFTART